MIKKTDLASIEIGPEKEADKTIIWLHGLGADANDFVPITQELNLPKSMNVRFIFPNAPVLPVTLNNGFRMPAWFDIYGIGPGSQVDSEGIANSVAAITNIISNEINRGIESRNIVLAGFSQGAVIALNCGITYEQPLAGVIALSGYFPLVEQVLGRASESNKNLPIFMGHGSEDPLVPQMLGLASYNALKNAGYRVSWHSYRMPHSVCAEEVKDISHWLSDVFK